LGSKQLAEELRNLNTAVLFYIDSLDSEQCADTTIPATKCLDEINSLLSSMQDRTAEAYFKCNLK